MKRQHEIAEFHSFAHSPYFRRAWLIGDVTLSAERNQIRKRVRSAYRVWYNVVHVEPFTQSAQVGLLDSAALAPVAVSRASNLCGLFPIPAPSVMRRCASLPRWMTRAFDVLALPVCVARLRTEYGLIGRKRTKDLSTLFAGKIELANTASPACARAKPRVARGHILEILIAGLADSGHALLCWTNLAAAFVATRRRAEACLLLIGRKTKCADFAVLKHSQIISRFRREPEYQADIARRMDLVFAGQDERVRKLAKPEPHESMPLFGGAA